MKERFSMRQVRVSYGTREILHGVDISVREGEFCALLGLNGSGKTTLLHAACGFLPMQGTCTADGVECTGLNERKRARLIAFIPQVGRIADGKTALEIVLMGFNAKLGLLEMPSRKDRETALEAMERLEIADLSDCDIGALSQGQRQLVVLARCMVQDAPVMLMDEPDSALDFLNKHRVLEKVRSLVHEEGKAGLITLHDPNFAMEYCDRILLLKNGTITGEIDRRNAGREEILEKLSGLYGDIILYENGDSYLMGKRPGTE